MINDVNIKDPVYNKPLKYNAFDRFWIKRVTDERDLPFVHLIFKISAILIPLVVLLFMPIPNILWWLIAGAYFVCNLFLLSGPFTLMMHCTSHRPFFKKKYKILNEYVPWVLGPFFGHSPGTYFSHHMGMHHAENNLEEDLSSTMMYQRDSLADFFRYFAAFFFGVIASLTNYHHIRHRLKMRNKVLIGEISFLTACVILMFVNIPATLVIFIIPLVLTRFSMMIGNWAQHSFVDFDDPGNCYKNSITCINTPYNNTCFNDGYHINHHLKPAMHYTMYPQHFESTKSEFAKNKALVFDGYHYLHIWY